MTDQIAADVLSAIYMSGQGRAYDTVSCNLIDRNPMSDRGALAVAQANEVAPTARSMRTAILCRHSLAAAREIISRRAAFGRSRQRNGEALRISERTLQGLDVIPDNTMPWSRREPSTAEVWSAPRK